MPYLKSKITSQKLITSAITLFKEKGFSKTSIRMISRLSNQNVATIYYYFPNGKYSIAKILQENFKKNCIKILRNYFRTEDFLLFRCVLMRFMLRELLQDEKQLFLYVESWKSDLDLNKSHIIEAYTIAKNQKLEVDINIVQRAIIINDNVWSGLYKAKFSGIHDISDMEIRDNTDIVLWRYMGLSDEKITETIQISKEILNDIPIQNILFLA